MADENCQQRNIADNHVNTVQSPLITAQQQVETNTENNHVACDTDTSTTQDEPREITQTDHLNKRLLNSFLDRLNQPNSGFPQVPRFDTQENKDIENERDGVDN